MSRRTFSHLTLVQRMQIEEYLSSGFSQTSIAKMLAVNRSTISRELKRNCVEQKVYSAPVAQAKTDVRRTEASCMPRKVTKRHLDYIYERMLLGESPDVISHCAPRKLRLSTPWVYEVVDRAIKANIDGDDEFKHFFLRKYQRRRGRKRKAAGVSLIPNRVDIDQRPKHVKNRRQFGHWEADLVIGKAHQGALLTLVERKTRFLVSHPLRGKSKDAVAAAIVERLSPVQAAVKSITFDNGLEFAAHERVSQGLQCDAYFAKPYRSYERGTNENLNGEIRRYYPKKRTLSNLDLDWFAYTIGLINERRRKILGYATAQERFDRELARLQLTERI